jgi:hypothetical protein
VGPGIKGLARLHEGENAGEQSMASTRTILPAILAGVCAVAIPACRGGSAKATSNTTTVDTGKALEDLDDAKAKGLISESEYQKERKAILAHK